MPLDKQAESITTRQRGKGMQMSEKVSPILVSGFRDTDPADMIAKQRLIDEIMAVYRSFGFEPLDTAVVQLQTVLFEEFEYTDMDFFQVENSRKFSHSEAPRMALRFDLTVPLARYVAANIATLPRPFKRAQIGKVYRGEKAQAGRYCEFLQADIDSLFTGSVYSDAEIVAVMFTLFKKLGIDKFKIVINNRMICNLFPQYAGFNPDDLTAVLRVLDKIRKVSREETVKGLSHKQDEESKNPVRFLSNSSIRKLMYLIEKQGSNEDLLIYLKVKYQRAGLDTTGIVELEKMYEYCRMMGVDDKNLQVDFAMVRGLAYYTGPIFETYLTELPEFGSVFSGGRYDNLVSKFTEANVPATGASVGVDRLFEALKQLSYLKPLGSVVDVMIMVLDRSYMPEYLLMAKEIRDNGYNVMIYDGVDMSFKTQLMRAVTNDIHFVVIVGKDEMDKQVVTVKDLKTRKQSVLSRNEFTTYHFLNIITGT